MATCTFEVGTGLATSPITFADVCAGPWGDGVRAAHFLLSSSLLLPNMMFDSFSESFAAFCAILLALLYPILEACDGGRLGPALAWPGRVGA